jgi:hypothetical protein
LKIRRVIAGCGADGTATVLADEAAPRADDFSSLPGFSSTLLWSTPADPQVGSGGVQDPTPGVASFVPAVGETRLLMVTFPPDSMMARADFDPIAFGEEFLQSSPGLAERFEVDHPGMHTTDSIDYDLVLDGEMTLELDGGREAVLKRHEVVVQHGNRHAWRNKSDQPATMLFVLIGAQRKP